MELGLKGKKAIVCASSQGLGYACALVLAQEGCEVFINGRNAEKLQQAAEKLRRQTGAVVIEVAADLNTDEGRTALLLACAEPDILINNNAGPPPGQLADWDHAAWMGALESNLLSAAMLMRQVIPGMRLRKFGRIVNITSSSVKSPIDVLGLSNGARSGLTGFVAGTSRSKIAGQGVTINNLLPGKFDTDRIRATLPAMAQKQGKTVDEMRAIQQAQIPAGRYGTPQEFGAICAFLCSQHAAYMTGQNVLADGGAYTGTY